MDSTIQPSNNRPQIFKQTRSVARTMLYAYKEKKVMNSKRPRGKKSLKASTEFYRTRIIQTGLTDFTSPAGSERKQSSGPPVYDYDIEQSARQFITRKSFENYQQKMSASFDFDRNISLRGNHHYVDPRVDELIEDVSLGDSIDLQHLDHLGSLLSEDRELRDLLSECHSNNKHNSGLCLCPVNTKLEARF